MRNEHRGSSPLTFGDCLLTQQAQLFLPGAENGLLPLDLGVLAWKRRGWATWWICSRVPPIRKGIEAGVVLTHPGAPDSLPNLHGLPKPMGSDLPAVGWCSEEGAGGAKATSSSADSEQSSSFHRPPPLASLAEWGPGTHPGTQKRTPAAALGSSICPPKSFPFYP